MDCTIGTNGARLRSNVFGRIRGPSLDIPGAPESALRVNPAPSLRRLTSFRRRFSLRVAVRPRRINNDEAQGPDQFENRMIQFMEGTGREKGRYGLERYTELKSVWVNLAFSHFAFALFRKSSMVAVGLLTFGSVRISMSAGPFALASSVKTVSNSSLLVARAEGIP